MSENCEKCGKPAQRLAWSIPGFKYLCIQCRDELAYTEEEIKERATHRPAFMKMLPYLEWGTQAFKPKPKWLK